MRSESSDQQAEAAALECVRQHEHDRLVVIQARLRSEREEAERRARQQRYPLPDFTPGEPTVPVDPWAPPVGAPKDVTRLDAYEVAALYADHRFGRPPERWVALSTESRGWLGALLLHVITTFGPPSLHATPHINPRTRRARMLAVVQLALTAAATPQARLAEVFAAYDADLRTLVEAFGPLDERVWLPVVHDARQHLPTSSLRAAIAQLDVERPLVTSVAADAIATVARRLVTGRGGAK